MTTIQIRFTCNEVGITVEGSDDGQKTWKMIELYRYRQYSRTGFGKRNTTHISPNRQMSEIKDAMTQQHAGVMSALVDQSQRFNIEFLPLP